MAVAVAHTTSRDLLARRLAIAAGVLATAGITFAAGWDKPDVTRSAATSAATESRDAAAATAQPSGSDTASVERTLIPAAPAPAAPATAAAGASSPATGTASAPAAATSSVETATTPTATAPSADEWAKATAPKLTAVQADVVAINASATRLDRTATAGACTTMTGHLSEITLPSPLAAVDGPLQEAVSLLGQAATMCTQGVAAGDAAMLTSAGTVLAHGSERLDAAVRQLGLATR